ncbi:hypothetical protein B7P43_G04148 [Cryptotermes secundus]|uniref:Kinase suppressor of Ras 2 n=1 Tax=Cryptotermes secundus TaxID=105785 RepID=A0A2J7RE51_9NEOP|nr:hypothetical protein B7P43_G04148 [Cryptotermes secundus]
MADEEAHQETRCDILDVVQSMIDISADRLEGLRTQCATSAELTQQEIRTLEGKLIKLFARQLMTKAKLQDDILPSERKHVPSLEQWLQVVGLSAESIQGVCQRVGTLEALQERSEHELRNILSERNAREEEVRRLNRALHNLKKYTEILLRDETPSEAGGDRGKFPTTPPPCKKHLTGLQQPADVYPLTKSKSHESQLGNRVEGADNLSNVEHIPRRGRLPTEPGPYCSEIGHTSPLISSPMKSPPYNSVGIDSSDDNSCKSTLQVPKSPRTPTVTRPMCHAINHRFTKTFKMIATCDFCDKQMFIGTGLKCKECKYKCHRDCESKVPPSCGLPRELVDEFRRTLQPDVFLPNQSPSMSRSSPSHHTSNLLANIRKNPKRQHPQPSINIPPFPQGPDSSSNTSSCNSSTPSSPALVMTTHTPHSTTKQQFHFPDVSHKQDGVTLETHPLVASPALEEVIETHKSNDSDRTVSASGSGSISTDSEQTPVRVDSQDSQVSDGEAVDRTWPRQNSLSMREWDIPFDELKIGEPIGTGRFGTVYRGNWHGDVAIRVLNMDYLDDEKTLEAFKLEVATFRKTRHENLVLFMGACMKLPRLAIVTSMCKGMTLYTHIHTCKDKFNMNKTTMVAQQISQGMGYLHARGIVHKDLKSKNIFLENGKVIITDFGLFSVTKLCFGNRKGNTLSIPPGWLCYLSPEIIRSLRVRRKHDEEELPFTKASDVYAFGTVWYELLCGEWPFKAQPPEAIIWQVGKGMKQSLANLQASRDVKDILTLCWSYRPSERPDFACLLKTLEKLPKKRLARSPSHPIHLSRSAESVF